MMSPEDFRKYIQPSLRSQSENVDHVLYHLDGPAAIKHMDALMEIEGIEMCIRDRLYDFKKAVEKLLKE